MFKVNDKVWAVVWGTVESKDRNMKLKFEHGTAVTSIVKVGTVESRKSDSVTIKHVGGSKTTVKLDFVYDNPRDAYKHLGALERGQAYNESR